MGATDVLLVEGAEDMHFFVHLLKQHGVPISDPGRRQPGKIAIENLGGFETLISEIPVWLRESDLRHLGVVVDADSDVAARWTHSAACMNAPGIRTYRINLPALERRSQTVGVPRWVYGSCLTTYVQVRLRISCDRSYRPMTYSGRASVRVWI